MEHPFQGPNVIFVRVKSLSRLPEPSGNFSTPFNNILLAAMNILYVLLKEKVVISASAHEFHNFISVNTSSLILSYTERPLYSETLLWFVGNTDYWCTQCIVTRARSSWSFDSLNFCVLLGFFVSSKSVWNLNIRRLLLLIFKSWSTRFTLS